MKKPSQFNTFFNKDDVFIGYNALSNQFILLDPLLYDLIVAGQKQKNFSELEQIHSDFYNLLISNGFLVNENVNEFDLVKSLSRQIDSDNTQFHLIINPTMNCNFKCWYCYETHIKDSKMDTSTIDAIINLVSSVVKNQIGLKRFIISFFGGEPLLYFDKVINPIIKRTTEICEESKVSVGGHITTNGLLINEKMLQDCQKYGISGFQITLDGNREQHNKVRYISEIRGSFDTIVDNIILSAKHNIYVNVRINCSDNTFEGISDILDSFSNISTLEKSYIVFDFHKVWQESVDISDKIAMAKAEFENKGFNISKSGAGTVIESCYADKKNQATINYDGEIFKCTARDFKTGTGEGRLKHDGTITWNEKYEKRLNSKFNNEPCKTCRVLPLCGGGCTQAAIEAGDGDYCVMGYDESLKTKLVQEKFEMICATLA